MQQTRSNRMSVCEMAKVGELEMEIATLETRHSSRLEEYGEDNLLTKMAKWDLAQKKDDLEDAQLIDSFSGRTKKAVKLMKRIHEDWMNETHPNDKEVQKVKALLNRERTDLELKIKALNERLVCVDGLESYTDFDHPTGWWNAVKRIFGED